MWFAAQMLQVAAKIAGKRRLTIDEIRFALRQGFIDAGRLDLAQWIYPER